MSKSNTAPSATESQQMNTIGEVPQTLSAAVRPFLNDARTFSNQKDDERIIMQKIAACKAAGMTRATAENALRTIDKAAKVLDAFRAECEAAGIQL